MQRFLWLSVFVLAGVISACGFHLRGVYELPQHLSPIYLDKGSMSQPLYKALHSTLKASGAELIDTSNGASSVITVSQEQRSRSIQSVDSSGRAREYGLKYSLVFSVRSATGMLIENSRIELNRVLLFDPDEVLGVANEERNIHNDMTRDSAGQIILRLQALK